jgi:hypothetical protein
MIGNMPETSFCFCLAHFSGMIFIWTSRAAKIAKTLQDNSRALFIGYNILLRRKMIHPLFPERIPGSVIPA